MRNKNALQQDACQLLQWLPLDVSSEGISVQRRFLSGAVSLSRGGGGSLSGGESLSEGGLFIRRGAPVYKGGSRETVREQDD